MSLRLALCKTKMSDRTQRTPFYGSAFRERDSSYFQTGSDRSSHSLESPQKELQTPRLIKNRNRNLQNH
ncbi:hypothetical protein LEP1GSC120_0834 [Leptospira santarosai str. 200702252]|nr:hypothetical protein LEP1GSC130_2018 [Leptospira santarosai str. 200403458]EMO98103.1 hypothetical protein LEP1GSC120_0834 [Leptospira santarosai str. 200702252]